MVRPALSSSTVHRSESSLTSWNKKTSCPPCTAAAYSFTMRAISKGAFISPCSWVAVWLYIAWALQPNTAYRHRYNERTLLTSLSSVSCSINLSPSRLQVKSVLTLLHLSTVTAYSKSQCDKNWPITSPYDMYVPTRSNHLDLKNAVFLAVIHFFFIAAAISLSDMTLFFSIDFSWSSRSSCNRGTQGVWALDTYVSVQL